MINFRSSVPFPLPLNHIRLVLFIQYEKSNGPSINMLIIIDFEESRDFVTANAGTPLTTTSAENEKNTKIIRSRENKMILLTFFSRNKEIVRNNTFVII